MSLRSRLAWFVALTLCYLWFIDEATKDEALAACVSAFAVVAFLERLNRTAPIKVRIPSEGLLTILRRVPAAALRESWDLLGPVLWRRLVLRQSVAGRWIALRYDSDVDEADGYGRRVIVVFGSGITPNALPLGIDGRLGRLYLHQLVARREAAASDPRFPI